MVTQKHQKMREKVEEVMKQSDHLKGQQSSHHQRQVLIQSSTTTTTSPPSNSSSPNHEFSFTISLHPPPATSLSPADDIFFHGHLLPLHLLSHFPLSPGSSSTNSLDSFTLPIKELLEDQNPIKKSHNNTNSSHETKGRTKSKSYSLFGRPKRQKGFEVKNHEDQEKPKRSLKLVDLSHVLKRYIKMMRPLLSFRWRRERIRLRQQPYSFSGNLSLRGKPEVRGRKGGLSAPASMRTSPTNSGLLISTETAPASKSDSTMEELHAAIQAAIAHCKNSIAMEEKIKC